MRNASQEDCQLLAESEILQRDLFVAAKDQKDHPKEREGCVQHEAGSLSASSLKINRLRDRWDLARHRRYPYTGSSRKACRSPLPFSIHPTICSLSLMPRALRSDGVFAYHR